MCCACCCCFFYNPVIIYIQHRLNYLYSIRHVHSLISERVSWNHFIPRFVLIIFYPLHLIILLYFGNINYIIQPMFQFTIVVALIIINRVLTEILLLLLYHSQIFLPFLNLSCMYVYVYY